MPNLLSPKEKISWISIKRSMLWTIESEACHWHTDLLWTMKEGKTLIKHPHKPEVHHLGAFHTLEKNAIEASKSQTKKEKKSAKSQIKRKACDDLQTMSKSVWKHVLSTLQEEAKPTSASNSPRAVGVLQPWVLVRQVVQTLGKQKLTKSPSRNKLHPPKKWQENTKETRRICQHVFAAISSGRKRNPQTKHLPTAGLVNRQMMTGLLGGQVGQVLEWTRMDLGVVC